MKEKNLNNNNTKSLSKLINDRHDRSEAILEFLRGLTVQECIDTLDTVRRKLFNRTQHYILGK